MPEEVKTCPLCLQGMLWFTSHADDPEVCMREHRARVRNLMASFGSHVRDYELEEERRCFD